jgi:hypothetical protein
LTIEPQRQVGIALRIAARSSGPVGDREGLAALWPDPTRGIVTRSTNTHPIGARGGVTSLSQMPVAHGGPAHYRSSCRFRALDTEMIKCGLIHEAQVNADPMKADSIGWEHGDLTAPQ